MAAIWTDELQAWESYTGLGPVESWPHVEALTYAPGVFRYFPPKLRSITKLRMTGTVTVTGTVSPDVELRCKFFNEAADDIFLTLPLVAGVNVLDGEYPLAEEMSISSATTTLVGYGTDINTLVLEFNLTSYEAFGEEALPDPSLGWTDLTPQTWYDWSNSDPITFPYTSAGPDGGVYVEEPVAVFGYSRENYVIKITTPIGMAEPMYAYYYSDSNLEGAILLTPGSEHFLEINNLATPWLSEPYLEVYFSSDEEGGGSDVDSTGTTIEVVYAAVYDGAYDGSAPPGSEPDPDPEPVCFWTATVGVTQNCAMETP